MSMRIVLLLFAVIFIFSGCSERQSKAVTSEVNTDTISATQPRSCEQCEHHKQEQLGQLGYPLGTYLRLEGYAAEEGKVNPLNYITVDTINGKELTERKTIYVELPKGKYFPGKIKLRINGYESGRMVGFPKNVLKAEHPDDWEKYQAQAVFSFHKYFVFTSSTFPEELPTAVKTQIGYDYPGSLIELRKERVEKNDRPAGLP